MKLQTALLFFLAVCSVIAQYPNNRNRDGLIDSVPGYAMTYYSSRYEPLCGTIMSMPTTLDEGTQCINAVQRYTNDTRETLAFYDAAGVKLVNVGVGMGRALCMCFAMATSTGVAYDICWYFNEIGQYWGDYNGFPYGSYRPGAAKALPQCGDVNVAQLQQSWTQTAIMPSATGPVETVNPDPTTVMQTITHTSTLTPTLVNLTISSSTVVTDSNGYTTTEDRSYTTTAAVINFEPTPDQGMSLSNRIALGVGLGFGVPTVLLALVACYRAGRHPPPVPLKDDLILPRRTY